MILLDTDHLTALKYDEHPQCRELRRRMDASEDLKMASIALMHDAILLSRNLRDFSRVPGLRIENWIG